MMTQEYLKSILDYNPQTGDFYWKQYRSGIKADFKAGCSNGRHIVICINRKLYLAHLLVWLYIYGKFPEKQIEHKNRIGDDNRIFNLRESTQSQNNANRVAYCKSGFKGVYKHRKRWQVKITKDGISYNIGSFKSIKDAAETYNKKAFEFFGEFACLNDIESIKD